MAQEKGAAMGRFALLLAYDGGGFFGSQVQNGTRVRTVAGELSRVLAGSGFAAPSAKVALASRTDRGVSAAMNVAAYDGARPILGKINHHLPPDMCAWGWARVPASFSPRHADWKRYSYFLPDEGQDEDLLRRALSYFTGAHDFANFAYHEKATVSSLDEASLSRVPGFFVATFRAGKFLRLQIRRMVAAADSASRGRMNLPLLDALISGKVRKGAETAPAEGLVLEEVDYGGRVTFEEKKPVAVSERFSMQARLASQRGAALKRIAGSD